MLLTVVVFVFSLVVKASGCSCQLGPSHTEWSLSRGPGSVWLVLVCTGHRGHRHIISWAHTGLFSKIHFPTSRKDRYSFKIWTTSLHKTSEVILWLIYCYALSPLSHSLTLWHWSWSLVTKLSLRELEPDWGQLLVNQSPHSPDPTLAICWHPPTGRLWISFVRI